MVSFRMGVVVGTPTLLRRGGLLGGVEAMDFEDPRRTGGGGGVLLVTERRLDGGTGGGVPPPLPPLAPGEPIFCDGGRW